jgi:ribosome biogenesis GTPase
VTARPPAWDQEWERAWTAHDRGDLEACRVVRIDKGGITAATRPDDERLVVAAKSARRVVVGDVCGLDAVAGRIESILPRRTVFERRSPGVSRDDVRLEARPVAANMDHVLVLQPLDTGVNLSRLARELVLAWESGARPVVVLTKADLVDADHVQAERSEAVRFSPGVEVVVVSVRDGRGLDQLAALCGPGRVMALLGPSGSGKSSLTNRLAGRPVQLVAEVRDSDHRGRHTTTAGQMVALAGGGYLIDTPGIRGVGLWAADDGLELAFADLEPFAGSCRFVDCSHRTEPGCGVLAAVEAGRVGRDRLEAFQRLVDELEGLEADLVERDRELERLDSRRSRRRARSRDDDQGP